MFHRFNRCMALIISLALAGSVLAQEEPKAEVDVEDIGPVAQEEPVVKESVVKESAVDASFIFRLKNNKYLQGVPMDFALLDIYVMGAKISLPIDSIVGVRFPDSPDQKATVALKDGELLNGKIDTPTIRLAVEWGEARINREVVKSMVKTPDLFWQLKDTPNGPKWFLAPKYYRSGTAKPKSDVVLASAERDATPEPSSAISTNANDLLANIDVAKFVAPALDPNEFRWIW